MARRAIQKAENIKNSLSSVLRRGQRSAEDEEQNEQNKSILDEFDLDTEIIVSKDVLLPEAVDAVAFGQTRPIGFDPDDVEVFVGEVMHSIEYYIQLIHDKNWGIHKLATEINENRTNIDNLKYQLQIHRGKGVAQVDEEGNYETYDPNESQDESALQDEINSLQTELAEKEEAISSLTDELSGFNQTIEELQGQLEQFQSYADQLEAYIETVSGASDEESDEYEEAPSIDEITDEDYDFDAEYQTDEYGEESYGDEDYDPSYSDDDYGQQYPELSDDSLDDDEVSAQQQLAELSTWGDEMEAALRNLEEQNNELQESLTEAQEQVAELQSRGKLHDNRDDIIEELTNTNADIREQFKISEAEKEELYKNYEEAVVVSQQQEAHITELDAYIDQLEKENKKLQDKANNVRVELDSDRYPSKKQTPSPQQRQQGGNNPAPAKKQGGLPTPKKQQETEAQKKRRVMFSADDLLAPEINDD